MMHTPINKQEKILTKDIIKRKNGLMYLKYKRIPFTGTAITERIPDNPFDLNTVERRENYKQGRPDGLFESFHDNCQLRWRWRENYKDGLPDGLWEVFQNGQLRRRENYKNGELEGLREFFDKEGNLYRSKIFKDGKEIK